MRRRVSCFFLAELVLSNLVEQYPRKEISPLKNPALFFGGIILALLGIALGIFFLVPNVPHVIADSNTHVKHAIACFVVAVLGVLVTLVNRPKAA
jgi:CDP-diglyceride synthetase